MPSPVKEMTKAPDRAATQGKARPKSRYLTGTPEQDKKLREGYIIASKSGEDRPGATRLTRNHRIIQQWAQARGGQPATVPGTEHDGHLGVLRFDFPGYGGRELRHVSWDEWFDAFDARHLAFVYQETRTDGTQSNFFRFDSPEREEA
ncbi:MAG: hypothetical protein ACUVX9_02140 [Anaerolineae bacterium]